MGGRGSTSRTGRTRKGLTSEEHDKYAANVIYDRNSITRKQAGVLYSAYKRGDLDVTKAQMNMMYDEYVSSVPSWTTDSKTSDVVARLQIAVSAAASNDYDAAYRAFQNYLDIHYIYFDDPNHPDDR